MRATFTDVILRCPRAGAGLEGWPRVRAVHPSFEARHSPSKTGVIALYGAHLRMTMKLLIAPIKKPIPEGRDRSTISQFQFRA
jgi:hypothetical protein